MRNELGRIRIVLRALHSEDSGQDLVEYAFIAAAIALGAAAAMGTVAEQVNSVFLALASKFQIAS
ncbi:MAG TPA: Flp family type IVb pilin [Terriglobia bacterium]|nr:Flp family type IVb pilin [Terriglobia bacterium]